MALDGFEFPGAEGHERLERLESLTTEIWFEVLTYRKA